jgi:hypothetical protein
MVGAADRALDLAGRIDEDHAAMAADVVEDAHRARVVAQHQERLAEEASGFASPGSGHVGADADGGPCGFQAGPVLGGDGRGVGVMGVRQAAGAVDRGEHVGEGEGR